MWNKIDILNKNKDSARYKENENKNLDKEQGYYDKCRRNKNQ